jgi:hypothetical protein
MFIWLAVIIVASSSSATSATAQDKASEYTFLIAAGFLCDPGDSSACPASLKSTIGDSYEMSGAGRLNVQSKTVQAAGSFSHRAPNGTLIDTGVWIVNELIGFDSYGVVPGAIRKRGAALAPRPFGLKPLPKLTGALPAGGLAAFRILLVPTSGVSKTAVLQVNCALGNAPREHSVDGIQLNFDKNGGEFTEGVGGHVMFLSTQARVSTAGKSTENDQLPSFAETPKN